MFSKAVAGITSPVVTPESASSQDISTDVTKIVHAADRCCAGLSDIDPLPNTAKMINGLYDGAMTRELDRFSIQTSALLTVEEPPYAKLAAQPLVISIDKEVRSQDIYAFHGSYGSNERCRMALVMA